MPEKIQQSRLTSESKPAKNPNERANKGLNLLNPILAIAAIPFLPIDASEDKVYGKGDRRSMRPYDDHRSDHGHHHHHEHRHKHRSDGERDAVKRTERRDVKKESEGRKEHYHQEETRRSYESGSGSGSRRSYESSGSSRR